jgi:site-specific recombinase XerD
MIIDYSIRVTGDTKMSKELTVQRPEDALIAEWHSWITNQTGEGNYTETTAATYRNGFSKFFTWLQDGKFEQVSAKIIDQWKRELLGKSKPSTVNTWLAGVRSFFAWANSEGLLSIDPTASVKVVKRKNANKRHLREKLSDKEVLRLLALPDRTKPGGKRDYAILCLKAYVPIRDIEIHRADYVDLTTRDDKPVLLVQGKGSREKNETKVLASSQLQDAIYDWIAERGNWQGPLFTSLSNRSKKHRLSLVAIRHIVKMYYRLAGIYDTRKTSHSMRHSAITKIVQKAGVLKAQEAAGHASIDTTMIYHHEANRMNDPGEAYIDYA